MPYMPQFEYDIFVSYAHVDNPLVPGAERGWVTDFAHFLELRLAQLFGRRDAYTLWMDRELRNAQPVTPQILDIARRSAVLVILLSPGYIASEWCRNERDAFLGIVSEREDRTVLVAELERMDEVRRPAELSDLNPFRFWAERSGPRGSARRLGFPRPHPEDREYYDRIDDLAREIFGELKRIASGPHLLAAPAATPHAGPMQTAAGPKSVSANGSVFLAQVTDDLDSDRNGVRRYLEQAGINVAPKGWYSLDPNAFRKAAMGDIAEADLFVQLLSEIPGKRPPDLPEGYLQLQLQIALEMNKPVLQWRSPRINLTEIEDESHRALLDRETVQAEGIEEFKQSIKRRLDALRRPPSTRRQPEAFVFVDMDSVDRSLAEELCDILYRHGAGYILQSDTPDPGEYRRELEENLSQCDGLVVVYGSTTVNWVKNALLGCRKALATRPSLPTLAVFEGPPAPKDRLPIKLPNMMVLNCHNGVDEDAIDRFLASIRAQAA
ncbi:MAG: toll/interleukin-1 receptor domain-containing protein [Acetobacteraceae bacterium]|nr:toll/interleukin-1 receptor domain-containing protein [Acetobacteraceae bacterium]